jgi:glucose/arabinose dehydrogenase
MASFSLPGLSLEQPAGNDIYLDKIKLPPGFKIELYARVPNARQMTMSPSGTLYVGTRAIPTPAGLPAKLASSAPAPVGTALLGREAPYSAKVGLMEVDAVLPANTNGLHDKVVPVLKGLNMPTGVAFKDGSLFIADMDKIMRIDNVEKDLEHPPAPLVINDSFPTNTRHGWKYITFGPDGLLYVPHGVPFNRGDVRDVRFGTITRMDTNGLNPEIYARGIRNSVGLDFNPKTKQLWFTDNGPDGFGDNAPPDELNQVTKPGQDFGFPYIFGSSLTDPDYGKGWKPADLTAPAYELDPHVAVLGMKFYSGTMFPQEYRGDVILAEHGSWNSTKKVGYRLTRVHFKGGKPVSYEPFATGFLMSEDKAWGRPNDVLVAPDGSLLVSDDMAGAIYRISYTGK